MGILLGLATALAWGTSDFFARFVTRRIGTLRSLFYMQTWGFLLLTAYLLFTHSWGHLIDGSGWRPWAWGLLAGACNTVAMFSFGLCTAAGRQARRRRGRQHGARVATLEGSKALPRPSCDWLVRSCSLFRKRRSLELRGLYSLLLSSVSSSGCWAFALSQQQVPSRLCG